MTGFKGNQHTPAPEPAPAKKDPLTISDENVRAARKALRAYDALTDYRQRIGAHMAIKEKYGVDVDVLRCKLARWDRREDAEIIDGKIQEAKAQLEQQKIDAQGRAGGPKPITIDTPNARAQQAKHRGGRQPNGTLGVAEQSVTPAAKRGRPRATDQ